MLPDPRWKIGVEIETMAPRGASREDLARKIAEAACGRVRRFFHAQSEPSLVPGQPIFENLTLGFRAEDAQRRPIATFVDDLTLQDDCDRLAPARPGWYRIVGDDARWLRLCARHSDAQADLPDAIDRFAAVIGVRPQLGPDGMWRIADAAGASIVIAAPLPGERDRPCEIVTVPIERDHEAALEAVLRPARELGFFPAAEGAVHLHFDAQPLRSARTLARLIRLWDAVGAELRELVGTNPRCRRLGPASPAILALAADPTFEGLAWEDARARLIEAAPSKYVDLNLRNLALETPGKHTVEVRILPVSMHAGPIVAAMRLFTAVFERAIGVEPVPEIERVHRFRGARDQAL